LAIPLENRVRHDRGADVCDDEVLTLENTYHTPRGRGCKKCRVDNNRPWLERKKSAA
jgi:hypothetical protein